MLNVLKGLDLGYGSRHIYNMTAYRINILQKKDSSKMNFSDMTSMQFVLNDV